LLLFPSPSSPPPSLWEGGGYEIRRGRIKEGEGILNFGHLNLFRI